MVIKVQQTKDTMYTILLITLSQQDLSMAVSTEGDVDVYGSTEVLEGTLQQQRAAWTSTRVTTSTEHNEH